MKGPRKISREKFGSAQGYSRVTKLPQQSRNYQSRKLLHKFRNHPHFRFETVFTRFASANMFKLWTWEIINCVLAIGMLGSMYGILQRYDGQRIPDWGSAINLSTLIALMATLLRTMLVFVVAEIIGQAKWQYFACNGRLTKDPPMRRLMEASRFNDASQGSLGAVKLIPTITRDPAILLAVTVMVISLGTGSFAQQAIQTQSCYFPVDSAHASLPVSYFIDPYAVGTNKAGDSNTIQSLDESNLAAALTSALSPDSEEIGSPISVSDCGEAYWLASFLADDLNGTTAASIIERIEALTDRLSNKMRMGLFNNPEAVFGQVLQATVCSRIDYSWLTFPAVLVAVTSGLLVWTMLRSSRCRGREMVWKTSLLPFLFYGERFVVQNGDDVSDYSAEASRRDGPNEPLLNLGQMEAEAKQRVVRFDVFD
ncbi:hypothetical protein INS49_000705 [Diaporthe citri]|uniref:uncharacterized protein n=1 Tax=Diaporthe citri TaxID=83186 RepID=UPI001C8217C4|nr:uncharacterized protein INS49_000705 [Diaporthe citri]KAG6366528.1 hypothetical protein INS49_000705 [Diaporthe citri]